MVSRGEGKRRARTVQGSTQHAGQCPYARAAVHCVGQQCTVWGSSALCGAAVHCVGGMVCGGMVCEAVPIVFAAVVIARTRVPTRRALNATG